MRTDSRLWLSWVDNMASAPEIMLSLEVEGMLVKVVLASRELLDMSWQEVMALANSVLGELVSLHLAILTGVLEGVLVATPVLIKSNFNLSNPCTMLSLTALTRGEMILEMSV